MSDQLKLEGEVVTKKVTRLVDVKLQPAEMARLGAEAGQLSGELRRVSAAAEARIKEVKTEEQQKVAKAEQELGAVLEKLEKETESRNEECEMKLYPMNRLVQVWFDGNMIEERAMTEDEFGSSSEPEFSEVHHGVVLDAEETDGEMTEEEAKQDLVDVMRDERNPNKPSLVDSNGGEITH